jgi:hypothetical protein
LDPIGLEEVLKGLLYEMEVATGGKAPDIDSDFDLVLSKKVQKLIGRTVARPKRIDQILLLFKIQSSSALSDLSSIPLFLRG